MYGDDWRYARSRLQNSVVAWKDVLVRIEEVYNGRATFTVVSKSVEKFGECALGELDVKPLRLGFVNWNGTASYICRAPMRRDWKQGVRHSSMRSLHGYQPRQIPFLCINNTHKGKFPKLETCKRIIGTDAKSKAWARDWALDRHGNVMYRGGTIVGKINNGVPELTPRFIHLQENLEASYEKG